MGISHRFRAWIIQVSQSARKEILISQAVCLFLLTLCGHTTQGQDGPFSFNCTCKMPQVCYNFCFTLMTLLCLCLDTIHAFCVHLLSVHTFLLYLIFSCFFPRWKCIWLNLLRLSSFVYLLHWFMPVITKVVPISHLSYACYYKEDKGTLWNVL